jgi:FkbM family methyltransferase
VLWSIAMREATARRALAGLHSSPTIRAIVYSLFMGTLMQRIAVRVADHHPLRLAMVTMTRSAYVEVRWAGIQQLSPFPLSRRPRFERVSPEPGRLAALRCWREPSLWNRLIAIYRRQPDPQPPIGCFEMSIDSLYWWLRTNGNKWNERSGVRRYLALFLWSLFTVLHIWRHPMSNGRRIRVFNTFLRWEFMRRRGAHDAASDLSVGASILCPPWLGDSRYYIALGYHDYSEFSFMLALLREDDLFVDIGAFLGAYSIIAANRGATVHAFEPSSKNRKPLTRAIEMNGYMDRVTIHSTAVANHHGEAFFSNSWGSGNRLLDESGHDDTARQVVQVRRLDDISSPFEVRELAVLKIDAEGFDIDVLKGGRSFLERHNPVLIVEFWEGGADIRAWLKRAGYSLYTYDYTKRKLVDAVVNDKMDGNLIACTERRRPMIDDRLANAPRIALNLPTVRWRL